MGRTTESITIFVIYLKHFISLKLMICIKITWEIYDIFYSYYYYIIIIFFNIHFLNVQEGGKDTYLITKSNEKTLVLTFKIVLL